MGLVQAVKTMVGVGPSVEDLARAVVATKAAIIELAAKESDLVRRVDDARIEVRLGKLGPDAVEILQSEVVRCGIERAELQERAQTDAMALERLAGDQYAVGCRKRQGALESAEQERAKNLQDGFVKLMDAAELFHRAGCGVLPDDCNGLGSLNVVLQGLMRVCSNQYASIGICVAQQMSRARVTAAREIGRKHAVCDSELNNWRALGARGLLKQIVDRVAPAAAPERQVASAEVWLRACVNKACPGRRARIVDEVVIDGRKIQKMECCSCGLRYDKEFVPRDFAKEQRIAVTVMKLQKKAGVQVPGAVASSAYAVITGGSRAREIDAKACAEFLATTEQALLKNAKVSPQVNIQKALAIISGKPMAAEEKPAAAAAG